MIAKIFSVCLVAWFFTAVNTVDIQAATRFIRVLEQDLPLAGIEVTGVGYPSGKHISFPQKRLMAKRAATVDAYRKLAEIINGMSRFIYDGAERIQSSGFIRGARITEVRYYADGRVDVSLLLPVSLRSNPRGRQDSWSNIMADIDARYCPVYYTEEPMRQITEEEWLKLTSD